MYTVVPEAAAAGTQAGKRQHQVTVLVGSSLTPGDLEELKEIIEAFGLRPVVIPDLSDSLDGRLTADEFSPLTIGGTAVSELATLGDSLATLVIGASMYKAADLLQQRTGVPDFRFDHLMGLEAMDKFVAALAEISGEQVPAKLERQRAQLQDCMLDTHFMLGMSRVGIAADPDLLIAFSEMLGGMGVTTVAAVAPANAKVLKQVPTQQVIVGDLEELEVHSRQNDAEFIISNSHAVETAERLGLPLLRAGFPQYDLLGGYQRVWIGYHGTRQTLFELANILMKLERGEIHPYNSIYAPAYKQTSEHAHAAGKAPEDTGFRH